MEQAHILSDDKSALLDIFIWLFLVCAVLGVIAQTSTKLLIRRYLGPEDYLILLSLAFGIAQSICVSVQVSNGLGKKIGTLDDAQKKTVMKADYASYILFMLCICFTKLSLVIFIKTLAVRKVYLYAVYGLMAFTSAWTVCSIFAYAFQCHLPHPWNYVDNTCNNRKAILNFYSVMNILTDLGPIILMIALASGIQTSLSRKITVAGVFGSRIVVIGAVICQLYFTNKAMPTSDPTFDLWPAWICILLVQALAIITASVPYLKPFMDSLESGGFRADDQRRRGTNGYGYGSSHSNGYKKNASSRSNNISATDASGNNGTRRSRRQRDSDINGLELGIMSSLGRLRGQNGAKAEGCPGDDWDDDGNSQTSQSRIIKETRTFTVKVENIRP